MISAAVTAPKGATTPSGTSWYDETSVGATWGTRHAEACGIKCACRVLPGMWWGAVEKGQGVA